MREEIAAGLHDELCPNDYSHQSSEAKMQAAVSHGDRCQGDRCQAPFGFLRGEEIGAGHRLVSC